MSNQTIEVSTPLYDIAADMVGRKDLLQSINEAISLMSSSHPRIWGSVGSGKTSGVPYLITHGDLHTDNFFVSESQAFYVIDFERSSNSVRDCLLLERELVVLDSINRLSGDNAQSFEPNPARQFLIAHYLRTHHRFSLVHNYKNHFANLVERIKSAKASEEEASKEQLHRLLLPLLILLIFVIRVLISCIRKKVIGLSTCFSLLSPRRRDEVFLRKRPDSLWFPTFLSTTLFCLYRSRVQRVYVLEVTHGH